MNNRDFPYQELSARNSRFTLYRGGSNEYTKVSYPLHCGIYSEIETPAFKFHFNLNHEIIRIIGKTASWPHPQEWLKRTAGNDWVYYSTGGYTGVFETTGEYYLPNLPYPTNKFLGGNPHQDPVIRAYTQNWHPMLVELNDKISGESPKITAFIDKILEQNPAVLADKAHQLAQICDGCTSVLPPDTRHVDYNVIPISITRGCLHKCRFCRVKNSQPFSPRTREQISSQLAGLKRLFGRDLVNYNAIFLGEHDGLQGGEELILSTIAEAQQQLGLARSALRGCNTFLFGSVKSLLEAPISLFTGLESMVGSTYINIGLESADQATLDMLGKPISSSQVTAAFDRMQAINDEFNSIEITANFVIGRELDASHYDALFKLVRDRLPRTRSKGCVYLSPLEENDVSRARLFDFYRYKIMSRLPLFLYMIQRL